MKLSKMIESYCAEHNLSYRKFADKCNVTNGYITMLISEVNPKTGKPIKPQIETLKKIAGGMGMTLNDLLSSVDEISIDISGSSPAKQRLHDLIDTLPEKKAERLLEIFLSLIEMLD